MYYTKFNTPLCEVVLVGNEQGLTNMHLYTDKGNRVMQIAKDWVYNDGFFSTEKEQVLEYFKGERNEFTVKINPQGTEFQKRVWNELTKIPFGEVVTYKQLAEKIGNKNASRAVGSANGKNPIAIVIPCHRVIGTNGKLTGYAHGIEAKQKLINGEKLITVFNTLLQYYGPQHWWPASNDYEMMVGAILTQNTSWKNVIKSLNNFNNKLSPELVKSISETNLAKIIKPSGYFNQKAKKLKALNNWFEKYNYNIEKAKKKGITTLRAELLSIFGVGRETADSILTYALKKPSFVIDTYTRRLFKRLGLTIPKDYDELRLLVEGAIPCDLQLYNEFHALVVKHSTEYCFKTPKCEGCPLYKICQKRDDIF